ncbi:MAG TPA: DUF1732 domain-containing protein, partial [bacterium]|nr:DUF1732 domain-containing protein [bacterium]
PDTSGILILNRGLCRSYYQLATEITEMLDIPSGLTAERLLRMNDIVSTASSVADEKVLMNVLDEALDRALEHLDRMRQGEGDLLIQDMQKHLSHMISLEPQLRGYAERQPAAIRERLLKGITQMSDTGEIDENRVAQEVLMWVVKADITEEITRLNAHIDRMQALLNSRSSIGKEADFLLQEMHREINTIGSKSALTEISKMTVMLKMDIEKLREQAQNLE